jgi:hypothetical protein
MPITAFNSFTDGLDPSRRSREHFIANIDVDDARRWVPYADGVWFQPCHFNVTSGGFSVVLKGLPGLITTWAPFAVIRCAVTGDTSSTTGWPSQGLSSMNPRVKRTRW